MAVGPILAVNYAGFRLAAEWAGTGYLMLYSLTMAVPMISLLGTGLALALVNLCQGRRVSPFLLGFEVVGTVVMALALACVFWRRDWVDAYITTVMSPLLPLIDSVGSKLGVPREPRIWENIWRITGSVLETLPQLLLAILGGWVYNKGRRVAGAEAFVPQSSVKAG